MSRRSRRKSKPAKTAAKNVLDGIPDEPTMARPGAVAAGASVPASGPPNPPKPPAERVAIEVDEDVGVEARPIDLDALSSALHPYGAGIHQAMLYFDSVAEASERGDDDLFSAAEQCYSGLATAYRGYLALQTLLAPESD